MAAPNPFFLWLLYKLYCKRFYKKPENEGKKPKGCLSWFLSLYLKILLVAVLLIAILFLIELIAAAFA